MPTKKRVVDVKPPLAGINKRMAFQSQPPYTTPDCLNVAPTDPMQKRERVGSRPGFGPMFARKIGSPGSFEVRSLCDVTIVNPSSSSSWTDYFNPPSLGDEWNHLYWMGTSPPGISSDGYATAGYNDPSGVVRSELVFDGTAEYSIELALVPDGVYDATYSIWAQMDKVDPNPATNGVTFTLDLNNTAYSATLTFYRSGSSIQSSTQYGTISSGSTSGVMKMVVNSGGTVGFVSCYYDTTLLISHPGPPYFDYNPYTGRVFGFQLGVPDRT